MGRVKMAVGVGVTAAAMGAAVVVGVASASTPAPAPRSHPVALAAASTPVRPATAEQIAKQFVELTFHTTSSAVRTIAVSTQGWYEVFLKSSASGYVVLVDVTTGQHGGSKVLPLNQFQDVLDTAH